MSENEQSTIAPDPSIPAATSSAASPPAPAAGEQAAKPPATTPPVPGGAPPRGGDRGAKPKRGPMEGRKPAGLKPLDDLTIRAPNLRALDADLEAELNAAMSGFDQKSLIGSDQPQPKAAPGEGGRKRGRVVAVHGEDVFVDVPGGRSQGMMSLDQFDGIPPDIGTEVDVEIDGYDRANGLVLMSRKGAVQTVDWSSVEVGMVVEARVIETNKGGLAVEVNGIRGFMPMSQIDMYRVEQVEQFVNQKLRCQVMEVKPDERNLVVSRRALLEKDRDEQREKFWAGLEVGQKREGVVRSLLPFGAFVDLGGADGLIPIGELAWTRVNHPSDVVKEGQKVEVKVIKLDRETRKIGLSLRQMGVSPWDTLGQRLYVGQIVTRKITRLMDFGAFVELEPGIEGLVHISEIAPQRISRPSAVVQEGQEVNVKVLNIDKETRRIALSIKQAQSAPEEEAEEETAEESGPPKPERPRNLNLRGGVGTAWKMPEKQ